MIHEVQNAGTNWKCVTIGFMRYSQPSQILGLNALLQTTPGHLTTLSHSRLSQSLGSHIRNSAVKVIRRPKAQHGIQGLVKSCPIGGLTTDESAIYIENDEHSEEPSRGGFGRLTESFRSDDGERKTLLTRQIPIEPFPASDLFALEFGPLLFEGFHGVDLRMIKLANGAKPSTSFRLLCLQQAHPPLPAHLSPVIFCQLGFGAPPPTLLRPAQARKPMLLPTESARRSVTAVRTTARPLVTWRRA